MSFAAMMPSKWATTGVSSTYKHWKLEVLSIHSNTFLHISELVFVDPDDTPISMAGATYDDSNHYPGYGPEKMFDKVVSNGGNGWSPDPFSSPEWFTVAFPSAVTVGSIHVNVFGNTYGVPKDVKLYGSDNGTSWTQLATHQFSGDNSGHWVDNPLILVPGSYSDPPTGYDS